MQKILFLDVDGTLMDYQNKLPASAKQAMQIAKANGHRMYICTGRSRAEVYPELWNLGIDGMIGGNGNYVEDHGKVILHQMITAEQCRKAVDWFHKQGIEFYLESNNGLFASEHFEEMALDSIRIYAGQKGKPGAQTMTVRDAFPDLIYGGELYRNDLNKISYLLRSYQDFLDTKAQFPELESHTWGGAGQTVLFGDLGVKNISKATAVQALLQYIGTDIADTIAFGDANIDIPMLECCAYGVAMGNGSAEIKAIADYITGDVSQDGLYQAFAHLGLLTHPKET